MRDSLLTEQLTEITSKYLSTKLPYNRYNKRNRLNMDSQADTVNRHYSDDDVRHLGPDETKMSTLHKMRTAGSVSISPELFEKLYLNPKTPATGNLRRMIGNPTPV